jgi:hypothetical protein
MYEFILQLQSDTFPGAFRDIIIISPIILTAIFAYMFWFLWVRYIRAKYLLSQKYVLLEIKLPKEMFKSPLAMELFLTSLHQTSGEGTWYAKYWLGKTRSWFSLEIISVEGQVKFFIWMRTSNRNFTESSLYAQFPGIEVHERDDYTRGTHFNPKELELEAFELKLTKEDAYPIKTYVDYGLDKDPKEEFKVDPIVPLLEYLGSIRPNQQIWIQILIRAHKKEQREPGHLWKKTDAWKDETEALINKLMKRDAKTKLAEVNPETGYSKMPMLSEADKDILTALARSITKQSFDVGIRCIYMAKKGFADPSGKGGIISSWKQFSTEHLNGFKPNDKIWHEKFDYPWQDYNNTRKDYNSQRAIMAYKYRSYFYPPFPHKPFVLNTEELATIFHFPGAIATTPTLSRIPSKKAEAPSNLPI